MTPISPEIIKQTLCSRDVKLNPPATDKQIASLNSRVEGIIHPYIVSIYRCFDGFSGDDFDAKSMMEVCPIDRIISSENRLFSTGYMPFSDHFGCADVFIKSFDNPEAPVIALFNGTKIASSTYEFWGKFLSGEFNITRHNIR